MRTYIVLLERNRKFLEQHEGQIYINMEEFLEECDSTLTDEEVDTLGYYELTDFMDLVNDQVLDNLTDTFLGYIYIKN